MAENVLLRTPSKHVAVHKTGNVNRVKIQRSLDVRPVYNSKILRSARTVYLCVLYGSENKQ
jgi:hypothetical protein